MGAREKAFCAPLQGTPNDDYEFFDETDRACNTTFGLRVLVHWSCSRYY